MALAGKRLQQQREVCAVCKYNTVDDEDDDEHVPPALIVPVEEPEVLYFTTDRECEECAFGIE